MAWQGEGKGRGTCKHGENPIDAGDFVEKRRHQDQFSAILEVEEAEKMLDSVNQALAPLPR